MTARRLLDLLVAWQTSQPETRHIVDDLGFALRGVIRDSVGSDREIAQLRELADRCDDAVKEMPDD